MLSRAAWQRRKSLDKIRDHVASSGRFVDMGVILRVVRQDFAQGKVLLPGKPPLTILRQHPFGGMVDRLSRPVDFCGPSVNPVIWYCSEAQEPLLLHRDDELPPKLLVYGAMGVGKTGCLVRWVGLRALELTGYRGARIGITAPTDARMLEVRRELGFIDDSGVSGCFPTSWWKWNERRMCYALANGVSLDCRATHVASAAAGSRIQGQTWMRVANDEIQDSIAADGDIEMRGRGAPDGKFKRYASCTAKDSSEWRSYRDRVRSTPRYWQVSKLLTNSAAFVHPDFWEEKKATMEPREYQRKVLAEDVGPESRVYTTWDRERNLSPRPLVGAKDVTALVLRGYGPNVHLLAGHDPGQIQDVTTLLKAYQLPGDDRHSWWVVDEIITMATTAEEHVTSVLKTLRSKWSCNVLGYDKKPVQGGASVHVRIDPYGNNDKRPGREVYETWRKYGIDARSAAYTQGKGSGRVPKEGGIDMVCRLLQNAHGDTRLYVDCDAQRQPVAPKLVEAFEMSERDPHGRAEIKERGKIDLSHYPASLRYALWPFERHLQVSREDIALEEEQG